MLKLIEYSVLGICIGLLSQMLLNKVISFSMIGNGIYNIFQGIVFRFDRSVTGNDGCYSSSRIIEYMQHFGTFTLIFICVLKKIDLPSPILMLLGGAIGVGAVKAAYNKTQEIKTTLDGACDADTTSK